MVIKKKSINNKKPQERIFHNHVYWEDYRHGLYENVLGIDKEYLSKKAIELLSNTRLCEKYMRMVIEKWVYSCEHNLSNYSLNRVAYIGQSACCIYAKVPAIITMSIWSSIDKKSRDKADEIANEVISEWELNRQLCLRFI